MHKNTYLVTGSFGQDGAYLSKLLLDLGHSVIGVGSPKRKNDPSRLVSLGIDKHPRLTFARVDITNSKHVTQLMESVRPAAVFNLASHSFLGSVKESHPDTAMVNIISVLNILEAISKTSRMTKFFQAGSSEMFGAAENSPQTELSRFFPRNIYGATKVFSHFASADYGSKDGLFCSAAILYNHESPLRPEQFVTRKISTFVAKIKCGYQGSLKIGNLSAIRDWGYAPEYVEGISSIVDHSEPDTFILSTGRPATVRDFVRLAFESVGVSIAFHGSGLDEVGFEVKSGRTLVSVEPEFFRPAEDIPLLGDASKARQVLGWEAKTTLEELIGIMVEHDLALAKTKGD